MQRWSLAVLVSALASLSGSAIGWDLVYSPAALCNGKDGLPIFDYQVVRELPHDPAAFTQGLLISGPWLFESTGLYGESSVRRLALSTGRQALRQSLPDDLFGEGLAEAKGRLYQLTWREGKVRIYRPDDLRLLESDGTSTLLMRDPTDLRVLDRRVVTAAGREVAMLNELEYANGRIFANVFQTVCVAVIEPADGTVSGWLHIGKLKRLVDRRSDDAETANGIAYNPETDTYYLTGKRWPQLFELRIPALAAKSL
jgi:glutamine cyclotransferase